jgi:orotate phosphoribosyltransferase
MLLELAQEKGIIQPEQAGQLLQWREDPANWTGV